MFQKFESTSFEDNKTSSREATPLVNILEPEAVPRVRAVKLKSLKLKNRPAIIQQRVSTPKRST